MDESGQPVWQWAISAFGEVEPTTAETGWIRARNGSAGQIQNTLPVAFNLRFPGQQFDEETGLHYNHHRYYDPYLTVGYTEADPLGLQAGWNRFAYVDGDPLGAVDPEGLAPNQTCMAITTSVGSVIGGLLGTCAGGVVGGAVGGAAGTLVLPVGGTVSGGTAAAVTGGRVGGAAGAAAGAAAGNTVGEAICPEECPPCEPYPVGTIGFQGPEVGQKGKDAGTPHYWLYQVEQKRPSCECFWREKTKSLTGQHHIYEQPNPSMAINLNGSGRPPRYPQ